MSHPPPHAPDHGKILKTLAKSLNVGGLLRDHPEWTRDDVRGALEAGADRISETHPTRDARDGPQESLPHSIILYADGASRGNPGPAGAGVVFCDEAGKIIGEVFDYLGESTNNVAE